MTFPDFFNSIPGAIVLISNQMLSVGSFGRHGLGDMLDTIFKVRVLKVAQNT